ETAWQQGHISNISESGVLLSAQNQFVQDQGAVEMLFEMPIEISGKKNSLVFCNGTVVRSGAKTKGKTSGFDLAVAISDYKFVHERVSPRAVAVTDLGSVTPRLRSKLHTRRTH